MTKKCLGSQKPSGPKTKVCNPKQTFYQHVMKRDLPKFCLMKKKKLNHFRENIKMYVNKWYVKNGKEFVKKNKKKYELLKLKTERK